MKIEKFTINSCCGKKSIIFKTDQPLTKHLLKCLVNLGFKESNHFTSAGILYVDNLDFIVTGPLGSNRLQVKCKKQVNCDQKLNDFENLLLKLE